MEYIIGLLLNGLEAIGVKDSVLHLITRVLCISFITLGIVFSIARYLNQDLPAKTKKRIAVITMFFNSFIVILWLDFLDIWANHTITVVEAIKYTFSSMFHYCISLIFYRFVCFNFFDIVNIILFERLLKLNKKTDTKNGEKADVKDDNNTTNQDKS